MSKTTYTVNDDAGQLNAGSVADLTAASYVIGVSSSLTYDWVGFRFISISIAQAATIQRAVLRLNLASISTATTANFTVAAEAADNSAAFAANANDISGRTQTTSEVLANRDVHDLGDGYYEFDVTVAVQAVINRAGWSSGNALSIILQGDTGSSIATISTKEHASNDDPQLSITTSSSADSARVSGAEENVDAGWTNISNIRADDGANATGTNMSTTESFTAKTFGIGGPSGSDTIDDIVVKVQWLSSSTAGRERLGVELSWDGGTSWSTKKYTLVAQTGIIDQYISAGPSGWGRTFAASEFSDTNFRLRVTPDSSTTTSDYQIDVLTVQVYYTVAAGTAIKDIIGMGTILFPR